MILKLNPHMVLLAEIRYRDAHKSYLPALHPWWLRDANGRIVAGWKEGGFLCLDFHNPDFRRQVAKQCKAAVESGVVDGVMLDWWRDDPSRLRSVREVRRAVGERALIAANANTRKTPQTAPYLNGYFMECTTTATAKDWSEIADTLAWAEANLKKPRVNCLETWFHKSRDDLDLMRATTALALTASDGYCLFSDPNPLPTPDHLHNWYPFWDKSLGRPIVKGRLNRDGTTSRDFENGTAIYNPAGNVPVVVKFPEARTSLATGQAGPTHRLGSPDGDIYLQEKPSSSGQKAAARLPPGNRRVDLGNRRLDVGGCLGMLGADFRQGPLQYLLGLLQLAVRDRLGFVHGRFSGLGGFFAAIAAALAAEPGWALCGASPGPASHCGPLWLPPPDGRCNRGWPGPTACGPTSKR